jgi:quercetin dioxygenase-like cupin family protein
MGAKTHGPVAVFADASALHDHTFGATVLALPAGARVAEHVHAGETELLYVLAGRGTLSIGGVDLPMTSTSVVQIPRNTRHAFAAAADLRAVQIFTPAGPEQRKAP